MYKPSPKCHKCGKTVKASYLTCNHCYASLYDRYALVKYTPQAYGTRGQLTLKEFSLLWTQGKSEVADHYMLFEVPAQYAFTELLPIKDLSPVVPGAPIEIGALVSNNGQPAFDSEDSVMVGVPGVIVEWGNPDSISFWCDYNFPAGSKTIKLYTYEV